MQCVRVLWLASKPGQAWVGSVTNEHNPSIESGIGVCMSSTVNAGMHIRIDHQINYSCFEEPFAVPLYRSLYSNMYGVIVERSI